MAFLVLIIAVLSRVAPHLMHLTGANVTMAGAGVIFFGASLSRGSRAWALLAVLMLAATDYWLTVYAYGYPFHVTGYLSTWLWYGAVCLGASALLHGRRGPLRVGAAAIASSTGFFLLSNGMVWMRGNMYPHSAAGLGQCYLAGLPFYRNDLASTRGVFCGLLRCYPWQRQSLRQVRAPVAGPSLQASV